MGLKGFRGAFCVLWSVVIVFFSCTWSQSARAELGITTLLAAASVGDINLPESSDVKDQGDTPYCALFAMSSFLELWASRHLGHKAEPFDPAFLALMYNAEVGDGVTGTVPSYFIPLLQKYGAIPVKVSIDSRLSLDWPMENWQKSHEALIDSEELESRLKAYYFIDDSWTKPVDYFEKAIGSDYSRLVRVETNANEPVKARVQETTKPSVWRTPLTDVIANIQKLTKEGGFSPTIYKRSPNSMFTMSAVQIFEGYPIYMGINTTKVTGKYFSHYKVIDEGDLVPRGSGTSSSHAVVGVGYCDTDNSNAKICRNFADEMRARGTDECFVIQNSWGSDSNAKGYICLSRVAYSRLVDWAYMRPEVISKNPGTGPRLRSED